MEEELRVCDSGDFKEVRGSSLEIRKDFRDGEMDV